MAKERDLELSGPPASGALHREWKEKKGKLHATVDQKYDMLVLRDKIIRLLSKPALSASDDNEGAVLGTCSEICPEKERYGRIKQDRVSIYEQDKHMVKDFSRQAADQEMPLPSELRTAKALRTTMNYLLREIIASPLEATDGSSGWYDFVWRRIRSIRKEITQQRLSGRATAEILEEMCRFHIAAFYIFCEADSTQFDQKLNLENLNDCLASLGRVYAEMQSGGEFSSNAAEFRVYEMLLRIWTDKLDLVKLTADLELLPVELRNCEELHVAEKIISACNNRIFSEYLVLMGQADYLVACLMHLYLPIVQTKALDSLAKASGGRNKPDIIVPLNTFVAMFGLESNMEVLRFCSYHDLILDREKGVVAFKQGSFRSRDPKLFRRPKSKKVTAAGEKYGSLAEIVAKRAMGDIPLPEIVEIDSFDEDGLYIGLDPFDDFNDGENEAPAAGVSPKTSVRSEKYLVETQTLHAPGFPPTIGGFVVDSIHEAPPQSPARVVPFPSIRRSYVLPSPILVPVADAKFPSEKKRKYLDDSPLVSDKVFQDGNVPPEKRRHSDARYRPESDIRKLSVSTPPSSLRLPSLSRSVSTTASSQSADGLERSLSKDYPRFTNMQILQARKICQAAALISTTFHAWHEHTLKMRRPTHHFGSTEPTRDEMEAVKRVRDNAQRQLLWSRFPFYSWLFSAKCLGSWTLLVMVCMDECNDQSSLVRWLRIKFGAPDNGKNDAVRVMAYRTEFATLNVIFVDAYRDEAATRGALGECAKHVDGVILFCLTRTDVLNGRRILQSLIYSRGRVDFPVALFSSDPSYSRRDVSGPFIDDHWLTDFFVPIARPYLDLSCTIWEAFLWIIASSAQRKPQLCTSLSRVVAKLFCDFTSIIRGMEKDLQLKLPRDNVVRIWNSLVDTGFQGVELKVGKDGCCDLLMEMLEVEHIIPYLQVEDSSLWTNPGRYPEVYPFGSQRELQDPHAVNFDIFAAIVEKILTVSGMTMMGDPVVLQAENDVYDFDFVYMKLLEQLNVKPTSALVTDLVTQTVMESDVTDVPLRSDNKAASILNDRNNLQQDKMKLTTFFGEMSQVLDDLQKG